MTLEFLRSSNAELSKLLKANDFKNPRIKEIIRSLKVTIYSIPSLQNQPTDFLIQARTFTELNLFYTLGSTTQPQKDFDMAIKNVQYFYENDLRLPKSEDHSQIRAIHLLMLLSSNKNQEFYSKLQNLSILQLNDPLIQYVLKINDAIEQGNYRRVFTLKKQNNIPHFTVFLDKISHTVRIQIAKSSEKAYSYLSIAEALVVFQVENQAQLKKFIQSYKKKQAEDQVDHVKWSIDGNKIHFQKQSKHKIKFNSDQLIKTSLHYANELQKIA